MRRPLRKIVLQELARDEGRRPHGRGVNGCSAAEPRKAWEVACRPGVASAGSVPCSARPAHDLGIGPVVRADERGRLERMCRHLLRLPLSSERLEVLPDRRERGGLRHAWRDGTTAVVMEPLDFLARTSSPPLDPGHLPGARNLARP